jgi:ParB family chromosome partitioning protein
MGEFFTVREPLKGYEVRFGVVPISQIRIPSIQRELSESLVKKLMMSIEKIGFVDPVLLIETEDGLEVINGQHRVEAAKLAGLREVLAIILPPEIKDYIISLNVEKAPNLRDKSHQAYEIFMEYLKKNPDMEETDLELMVEEPYYLTVGFIIDRFQDRRFPGYAFEKVLRKADSFLRVPLSEAEKERESRARLLMEVKEVLNKRYEDLQLQNALQKEAIVTKAFQNIYGKRVRTLEDDFYTVFEKLKEEIPKVTFTEEEISEF